MSIDESGPSLDDPLTPIVESFLARFRRGERPSLTEYEARHPDLADQIRDVLPALLELELGRGAFPQSPSDPFPEEPAATWGAAPERLGDYRILGEIGRGAMGVVYEAERECLQSRMALKVIHAHFRGNPQYLRRFHTEARSAAKLHHTNIVPVFDFGVHDGVCFYAMQLIAGQPLDRVLGDVIRLREGAETAPADQATVAGSQPEVEASAAPCEDVAVRTLSESLLSGRFAAPTAGAVSDIASGIRLRDSETGSGGALAFTLRPVTELPVEAPSATTGRPRSTRESGAISSSNLAARPDQLYYREIARLGE